MSYAQRIYRQSRALPGRAARLAATNQARARARGLLVRARRRVNRALARPLILRSVPGELKGMDTDLFTAIGNGGVIVDSTGTNSQIVPVNLVQQGNGSWNRVGRKISLRSLRVSGRLTLHAIQAGEAPNQYLTQSANLVRMTIVWDKQPSGALPLYSDIFGRTDQDGNETTSVLDPLRYDNTDRFRVLRDCRYQLNPGQNVNSQASSQVILDINEYVKLGHETVFSGQSDPMTIADISSGALYIIFRVVSGPAESKVTLTQTMCRLRYSD